MDLEGLKDKAADLADTAADAVDKVEEIIDEKTGGRFDSHTDKVSDALKDKLEDISDR